MTVSRRRSAVAWVVDEADALRRLLDSCPAHGR